MLFGLFDRRRMPRDRVTRIPRAAKRAGKPHAEAMAAAVADLAAMPGLADIRETRRVPRGFFAKVDELHRHHDAWVDVARKHLPIAGQAARAGQGDGCNACYAMPLGVGPVEALALYRQIRTWPDFPDVAQRMATQAEAQIELVQARHRGKDPEKIRLGSKAVREGRIEYARRKEPCALLDTKRRRCRAFEARPMICRMHLLAGAPEETDPARADWPAGVQAFNIRPPVKVQAALSQLDKRTVLQLAPFLAAGQLQILELAEGGLVQEIGEAPARLQQDGRLQHRANRNRPGAKKFKKKKKRRRA